MMTMMTTIIRENTHVWPYFAIISSFVQLQIRMFALDRNCLNFSLIAAVFASLNFFCSLNFSF